MGAVTEAQGNELAPAHPLLPLPAVGAWADAEARAQVPGGLDAVVGRAPSLSGGGFAEPGQLSRLNSLSLSPEILLPETAW